MTVIRRLDAVLEPTKQAVLKLSKQLDDAGVANKQAALCQASENAFYNISPFTLRDLRARYEIRDAHKIITFKTNRGSEQRKFRYPFDTVTF